MGRIFFDRNFVINHGSYGERQKVDDSSDEVLQLRQYPEREGIAYPKPGTPNPKIGLTVLKLPKGPRIALMPPEKFANQVALTPFFTFSSLTCRTFC